MAPLEVLFALLILIATVQLDNLLYVDWYPLYPWTNDVLWQLIPPFRPDFEGIYTCFRRTFLCCISFKPEPRWFDSIKIWRIGTPEKTLDLVMIVHTYLYKIYVRRSVVFLYESAWPFVLTFFSEWQKLWNKDIFLIPLPINASVRTALELSMLLIPFPLRFWAS